MKLSIILPIYNVEKYVEKCIRSLEDQDIPHSEYEIIAVDDGSLDASSSIVERLQKEFPNIKVVHKTNGGLSSARNYGLKYAQGEYIWFIDSDDYIESKVLSYLLFYLYTHNLDLLAFNCYDVWGTHEVFIEKKRPYDIIISGEEYVREYAIDISAWLFLVKREIILKYNIYFLEGIIHEDYEFTLRLYKYIHRMGFVNKRVYNYIHREGSITTTKTPEQDLKTIHSWQKIIQSESRFFTDKAAYDRYAWYHINHHKYIALTAFLKANITRAQKQIEFKKFREIKTFSIGKTKLGIVRNLMCRLYSVSWLYYLLLCYFPFPLRYICKQSKKGY